MEKKKSWLNRGLLISICILLLTITVVPLLLPTPEGISTPQQLADKDSRFININNISVHYKLYGSGEPYFILLHGTLMTTYTWHEIVEPLSKMGTVIAYDRPSFGLTSRPMPGEWDKESPYSYENQVELLLQLMDSFNIKQAILIGSSMGGGIAAMTAQQHPERVKALVLDDTVQSRHGIPAWARLLASTPQMRKIGPLFLHNKIFSFGEYLYGLSWHDPSKIKQEYKNEYSKILDLKDFDRGLWELIAAAKPFEDLLEFEKIKTPTLVITGDDDRVAGFKNMANGTQDIIKMASKLKDAKLVVIPECGHLPHEERPAEFIQAVSSFVSELPSSK